MQRFYFSCKAPSDSLHHQYGLYFEILSTTFYAKVLRCLHPTVRGYYPKHGIQVPIATMRVAKMRFGVDPSPTKVHDAEEPRIINGILTT